MLKGIGFQLLATLLFTVMAAIVRHLGDAVPPGQIVFMRGLFALLPIIIWTAASGQMRVAVKTDMIGGHFLRSLIGVGSMFFIFMALARLPLPDATALHYGAPLMTVILAVVLLGEKVGIYRWVAVVAGLTGIVVILWPHLSGGTLMAAITGTGDARMAQGALYALLGAAFSAGAAIQVRRLTQVAATATIVFYFSVFNALIGLASWPFGWVALDSQTAFLLIAAGCVGGVGQITLTQSYRYADASLVAPFNYTSMLWAVLIGWAVFGELPGVYVVAGATLVIASGLYLIHRERQLGLKRARARKAAQPPV